MPHLCCVQLLCPMCVLFPSPAFLPPALLMLLLQPAMCFLHTPAHTRTPGGRLLYLPFAALIHQYHASCLDGFFYISIEREKKEKPSCTAHPRRVSLCILHLVPLAAAAACQGRGQGTSWCFAPQHLHGCSCLLFSPAGRFPHPGRRKLPSFYFLHACTPCLCLNSNMARFCMEEEDMTDRHVWPGMALKIPDFKSREGEGGGGGNFHLQQEAYKLSCFTGGLGLHEGEWHGFYWKNWMVVLFYLGGRRKDRKTDRHKTGSMRGPREAGHRAGTRLPSFHSGGRISSPPHSSPEQLSL